MKKLLLALVLCSGGEEDVSVTVYLVKATRDDKPATDAALKEVEADLKELAPLNRFEIAGTGLMRFTTRSTDVRTQVAAVDGQRCGIGLFLSGSLENVGVELSEEAVTEEVVITGGGAATRTTRKIARTILKTVVNMPNGRLFVVGTTTIEGKTGTVTLLLVMKVTAR